MAFQVIFFVSIVNAQATRTWISGVGDDANPCSRTAPCKTFAGAISKTAVKGEIDVLDPGGFGAVTITKAITLDGGGNLAGVLASGTNGIVVNAGPTDVVILRNLDINGSGTGINGIQFLNGGMLFVENSTIYGFTQNGIIFTPTASSQLSIDRTLVRDASQGGLFVKPGASGTASAKITDSRFEQSSYGVRVEDRSVVSVINSVANNNTNNGFVAISTGGQALINLENCVATTNGRNGVFASGSGAVITTSNSTITNNAVMGINQQNGASIVSFGNNHIFGNTTNGTPTTILSPQ
ncbi:MAG: right-handed parallel beta-helix repeat-containing protein [Desulfuromonadales bacterium]|nr:right-handed parallel beta-helix repeat-containing protein [Desulfuromonadales bacterium]